jgi:hypothetical protein
MRETLLWRVALGFVLGQHPWLLATKYLLPFSMEDSCYRLAPTYNQMIGHDGSKLARDLTDTFLVPYVVI